MCGQRITFVGNFFRATAALIVIALLTLVFLGQNVLAQTSIDDPMRIGVILPETAMGELHEGERPASAAAAARLGAEFAREELRHNAELFGLDVDVLIVGAEGEGGAIEAAQRLLSEEGVYGLAGGFGSGTARALSDFAQENEIPFLNIGSADDALRNADCASYTFHVEPSDAMYLDAIAGFFVRAGFRRWAFVHEDDERGRALLDRAQWALRERHFGGRSVGAVALSDEPRWERVLDALRRHRPDVVLVLTGQEGQLEFLRRSQEAGETWEVAGMPLPDTQTRSFYEAWLQAGQGDETLYRAASWEATLDAYGAREFNERFAERWGTPMDPAAWASYQAVRILYDSAVAVGSLDGSGVASYISAPGTVFDVWKGIGVSFRPWDQQLRQSLFLVQLSQAADAGKVALVGELPALYMPRTDPIERLDQLGDLAGKSSCRLGTSNKIGRPYA